MNFFQQVLDFINAELQLMAEELREEVVDVQYQDYLDDQEAMYEEMYSRYQWEDEVDNFPYG